MSFSVDNVNKASTHQSWQPEICFYKRYLWKISFTACDRHRQVHLKRRK